MNFYDKFTGISNCLKLHGEVRTDLSTVFFDLSVGPYFTLLVE